MFRHSQVKYPSGRMETDQGAPEKTTCMHQDPGMGVRPQARVAMEFTL